MDDWSMNRPQLQATICQTENESELKLRWSCGRKDPNLWVWMILIKCRSTEIVKLNESLLAEIEPHKAEMKLQELWWWNMKLKANMNQNENWNWKLLHAYYMKQTTKLKGCNWNWSNLSPQVMLGRPAATATHGAPAALMMWPQGQGWMLEARLHVVTQIYRCSLKNLKFFLSWTQTVHTNLAPDSKGASAEFEEKFVKDRHSNTRANTNNK